MRERRSALQENELATAADQLAVNILTLLRSKDLYRSGIRVAGYLATEGEIPLQTCFEKLHVVGLETFVPMIRDGLLKFAPLTPQTTLRTGKYGIAIPVCEEADLLDALAIDIILTPLLAFDTSGNRLGMGGGYYDRTFEYLHPDTDKAKDASVEISNQLLIGVAHEFQKTDHIPIESWDVPLHKAVTDHGIYEFSSL